MKTGFICIAGLANAGKSTLINALVGEKVAIVSWRPQTTRNKILGIVNGGEDENAFQIVFIDTPGMYEPKNKLGDYMMQAVSSSLKDVDGILYVIDSAKGVQKQDYEFLEKYAEKNSIVVAVNKTDSVTQPTLFDTLVKLNGVQNLKAVVPISAKKQDGINDLLDELKPLLEEGAQMYPEDMYTDSSLRFMAAEAIREKALYLLDKEVPYGISVSIGKFEYRESKKKDENGDEVEICDIYADIICERDSHKAIIIGKGGQMLKKIATEARIDLENMIGCKVFLTLYVKVDENWRDNDFMLKELGYDKKELK